MRIFFCFLTISVCSFSLQASVNVDSIFATRYTKTLDDSVFVIGDLIRSPEIRFDLSGPGFTPDADSSFSLLAAFYRRNPFLITEIQVHTDTRGSADPSLTLSLHRARTIVAYLVKHYGDDFIFAERMLPVGKGESQPIVSEAFINLYKTDRLTFETYHQINRRIEIKITGFMGKKYYENQRSASTTFEVGNVRNSAYYEDLILIADKALLEGDYQRALEFYAYAADVAPAHETYAAEQLSKIRALLEILYPDED